MKKVMPDAELNRALAPKIAEERKKKAQEKARNQINYERYLQREQKLYEDAYKNLKHSSSHRLLPFLIFTLIVLLFIFILTYYPNLLFM